MGESRRTVNPLPYGLVGSNPIAPTNNQSLHHGERTMNSKLQTKGPWVNQIQEESVSSELERLQSLIPLGHSLTVLKISMDVKNEVEVVYEYTPPSRSRVAPSRKVFTCSEDGCILHWPLPKSDSQEQQWAPAQGMALALSLAGIILNAQKIIWCWPVWLASNILWIIHFLPHKKSQWGAITLNLVFFAFNVLGWVLWTTSK